MEYCQYHPLIPATWYCQSCDVCHCDDCVDMDQEPGAARCFVCDNSVQNLGAQFNAEPFWRRLQAAFRYPLCGNGLAVCAVAALLTSLVAYLPSVIGLFAYLLVFGSFMKYCFACLEETAGGKLMPPDIQSVYEGGFRLALQLIAMVVILGVAAVASYHYLGITIGGIVAVMIVLSLPAILINFALSERLLSALNPIHSLSLITTIGLPYGLLLALIGVMLGSVGVVSQLTLLSGLPFARTLDSFIGNYYAMVIFHIMGYMIFQYQGSLGFVARRDFGEPRAPLPEEKRLHAKATVLVKRGDYDAAVDVFRQIITRCEHDRLAYSRCFELLFVTANKTRLDSFLPHYIDFLIAHHREGEIALGYKRLLTRWPDYIPGDPHSRHAIAKVCIERNESKEGMRLINGMHKLFPDYPGLVDAYTLLHETLESMPRMQVQAGKCKQLVAQLQQKRRQGFALSSHRAHKQNSKTEQLLTNGSDSSGNGDLPPIEFN